MNFYIEKKEEEDELIEKQISNSDSESDSEKEDTFCQKWVLIKKGPFEELKQSIKNSFTIKQNSASKKKYLRFGYCKSVNCNAQVLLKEYLQQIKPAKLFESKIQHVQGCKYKDEVPCLFAHPVMKELIAGDRAPKEVIKEFNSRTKLNLENNDENRKRISNNRSYLKKIKKAATQNTTYSEEILNIFQLQEFIANNTLSARELQNIEGNTAFVCGSLQTEEEFVAVLTTKNLLQNYVKQGKSREKFLCLDGTYSLNEKRYPSLILGTVDSNRNFHLSNFHS
mgnify:CR=1 FL=1